MVRLFWASTAAIMICRGAVLGVAYITGQFRVSFKRCRITASSQKQIQTSEGFCVNSDEAAGQRLYRGLSKCAREYKEANMMKEASSGIQSVQSLYTAVLVLLRDSSRRTLPGIPNRL